MSMTNKTENELFNLGTSTDVFSLYDFNTNFEKADELIKALQDSDSANAEVVAILDETINDIKIQLGNVISNNNTNGDSILNIQSSLSDTNNRVSALENMRCVQFKIIPADGTEVVNENCFFDNTAKRGYLLFNVKRTVGAATGVPLFSVPSEYRPNVGQYGAALGVNNGNGAGTTMSIDTYGNVTQWATSNCTQISGIIEYYA